MELVVLTAQAPGATVFDASLPYRVIRKNCIKWSAIDEPHLGKAINLVKQFLSAWRIVVKENTDIIHIGQFYPGAFMGWLLSIVTGRPFIISTHGEELTGLKNAGFIRRFTVLFSLKRAMRVTANSTFTKNVLLQYGYDVSKTAVITPGIDPAKCERSVLREPRIWTVVKDKDIIFTVGRLTERKGQDMVLRILPGIIKDHPDVHYIIAGAGLEEARLKGLIVDLGLQKYVTLITNATDEEIAYLYQHCHLFIMPNRELANGDTEGFGIVFLEAGWWGKPVIGGKDGGVPDAVEDGVTGLLVDGNDIGQIGNAVRRLLGDAALCQRMGRAGRLKAMSNSWPKKTAQLRTVLLEAVRK